MGQIGIVLFLYVTSSMVICYTCNMSDKLLFIYNSIIKGEFINPGRFHLSKCDNSSVAVFLRLKKKRIFVEMMMYVN